jgi:hypothetical protein
MQFLDLRMDEAYGGCVGLGYVGSTRFMALQSLEWIQGRLTVAVRPQKRPFAVLLELTASPVLPALTA